MSESDPNTTNCSACSTPLPPGAISCAECGRSTGSATAVQRDGLLGSVINGKYEVLSVLGRGGMGVVYKVRHKLLSQNNLFAMKVLRPDVSANDAFRRRFLQEVEVVMRLTHSAIVQTRDFGVTQDGLLFFTMDFFEGRSLRDLIRASGPLPPARVIGIATQLLSGLRIAHELGIVHRDLKPENILVEAKGDRDTVRILDFGIAKVLSDEEATNELTQGCAIGSPKYMSPEQASGERVDVRSDLYSLGIILYEMLTGNPPFTGRTSRMILVQHLTDEPPTFDKVAPGLRVSKRVTGVVFRLLEKDPVRRPESAGEVLAVLDGDATASTRLVRRPRHRWKRVAALLMIAAAGAAAWATRESWLPPGVATVLEADASSRRDAAESAESEPVENALPVDPPVESRPTRTSTSHGEKSPSRPAPPRRLRCRVCELEFLPGELDADVHHDLPLVPAN